MRWVGLFGVYVGLLLRVAVGLAQASITGVVVDGQGPVAGARVRIQATTNLTLTAADGSFTLRGLAPGIPVTVSAWKGAYYCGKTEGVVPPASGITVTLRLYQTDDNPDYVWLPPIDDDPATCDCASCKRGVYDIWIANDAHARSTTNRRFLSMYNGTDVAGNPGVAPGYVQDFPGTRGNCANCHAPGAAVDAPFSTDMNTMTGADAFGVHCDFCHKVAGVYLNPATGLPYDNAPGVLSMDIRRPFPESERYQIFFGTFDDDNVPLEDAYLPVMEKSQYCAPCHQFSFWGTPIYQSFREWLESPYSQMGVECQTCHMPSDGVMTNVAPGFGGVERDPRTIHAHTMPGAASVELLQNTVDMALSGERLAGQMQVTVAITNTRAGHDVPTDHPARHMLLVVSASDALGRPLAYLGSQTIPAWGGDLAGRPGKAYAKVLRDVATGESPVASYWKQTTIESDNRLAAFASDRSVYEFRLPAGTGAVRINARLIFRRAFQSLMDQKGWQTPDILMGERTLVVGDGAAPPVHLPLLLQNRR